MSKTMGNLPQKMTAVRNQAPAWECGYLIGDPLAFGREDFRQTFYRLPFPLRDLIGVNAVLTGNLVDRSLPFLCVHRSSWVSSDITTLIRGLVFGEYYTPEIAPPTCGFTCNDLCYMIQSCKLRVVLLLPFIS